MLEAGAFLKGVSGGLYTRYDDAGTGKIATGLGNEKCWAKPGFY